VTAGAWWFGFNLYKYDQKQKRRKEGVTSFVISESAKRVIPLSVGGIMGNSSWINWDS
jgi:hypothetical protein